MQLTLECHAKGVGIPCVSNNRTTVQFTGTKVDFDDYAEPPNLNEIYSIELDYNAIIYMPQKEGEEFIEIF